MYNKKDTTFDDLREKSVMRWLDGMLCHEDIEVRGGVKVTTDYIRDLQHKISQLEEGHKVKDGYLKKMSRFKKKN